MNQAFQKRTFVHLGLGFGAGAVAWYLAQILFVSLPAPRQSEALIVRFLLLQAACFGAVLGGLLSVADVIWESSWQSVFQHHLGTLLMGAAIGAILCCLGHYAGYLVFRGSGEYAQFGGRFLGFVLAGLIGALGSVQSRRRLRNGLLGGVIGGIFGAVVYVVVAWVPYPLISSNTLAFAFPLWGACILAWLGYINWRNAPARIRGQDSNPSPKYHGHFYVDLEKDIENRLGSSYKCQVELNSSDLHPEHAAIWMDAGHWFIKPLDHGVELYVDNRLISRVTRLRHGALIRMGDLHFRFDLLERVQKENS